MKRLQAGQGRGVLILSALVLGVILLAGLGYMLTLPSGDTPSGENDDPLEKPDNQATAEQNLPIAIEAVAASEDADFERGIGLWKQLSKLYPQDSDLKLNQAVTLLKWIDVSHSRLSSGALTDPAEIQALQTELDAAYDLADGVIESLAAVEGADYRATLLRAALLEAQARRLNYPDDQQVRKAAAEVLADFLRANPDQAVVACKFDDLVQELGGGDGSEELNQLNRDALYASWKAQPRNLYLLSRAAETLLRAEDARVVELLDPSLELTKPMLGMVASSLRRLDPAELIANTKKAIENGDWRQARRVQMWINLFKGMSGFQPDVRLVKPDIMALLDTSFLTRFSDASEPGEPPARELDFELVDLGSAAKAVAWYDYDLDLNYDLLSLDGRRLCVTPYTDSGWEDQNAIHLELPEEATGFLIADLFEVETPSRPRNGPAVAQLMQDDSAAEPAFLASPEDEASNVELARRHDTLQELLVWGANGVRLVSSRPTADGTGRELFLLPDEIGLEHLPAVSAAVALDIESDGDLDVIFATEDGLRVCQNNGNRTFEDISQFSQFDTTNNNAVHLVAGDYDADLDQDVMIVDPSAKSLWLAENILHGQFRVRPLAKQPWPQLDQATYCGVADLDGNDSWDWLIAAQGEIVTTTTRTPQPGQVVPLAEDRLPADCQRFLVCDIDNDAVADLLQAGPGGLSASRRQLQSWSDPQQLADLDRPVTSLDCVDCNQDGAVDCALVVDGRAHVLLGRPRRGNFLNVRVRGIKDSNGGGRINHFSVGTTLEVWSAGRRQRAIVRHPSTHFGLGSDGADNLRITFPNGLTQNSERPQANTLVEELQELKGSCPFVYGWNGQRFELITDCLWNAPLGLQISRGQVMRDRRWEYLMLPGELVQPKDGVYELRMTEELWEVAYFDHIQLTAVDHPVDTELLTNEKVGPPDLAQPKLFVVGDKIFPQAATDSRGRDIRPALLERDRNYAQPFTRLVCQGLAEPHFVELDFGELPSGSDLHLALSGWMYPTDTSLNIALAQDPSRPAPEAPSLWVVDEQGQWVCAQPYMGFPGGKPKTIVVNLAGVFVSDDQRLRIGASQQIYWDQAFVFAGGQEAPRVEQLLECQTATLAYRGFGRLLPREHDQPHWYDYHQVSLAPKWPPLLGPFSRWGDVRKQLAHNDDRLVVMTAGDEIRLQFAAPKSELRPGWRRDFVLHNVGWDKDADLNTLAGQGSLPLPFAAQQGYPAPPEQTEAADEVWQLNRDSLTRRGRQRTDKIPSSLHQRASETGGQLSEY